MYNLKYEELNFDKLISEYEQYIDLLNKSNNLEESLDLIEKINIIRDDYFSMYWISYFRYSLNVKDEYFSKEQSKYSIYDPKFNTLRLKYYKALCDSKFRKEIEKIIGSKVYKVASLEVGLINDRVEDLYKEEIELSTSYNKLMASLEVEYDGQTIPLTKLNKYIYSKDRNIRIEAQKIRQKCLENKEKEIDEILDKLIIVRNKIASVLGYDSYTGLSYKLMKRIDYNEKDIKLLRNDVIKYIVPKVLELISNQKRELGQKELMYYDDHLLFKDGTSKILGDTTFIINTSLEMFKNIDSKLYDTFKMMVDNTLMDLECKSNKAGGAITTYIPKYKVPSIICNFTGASSDFRTLMHEFGHSFQLYSSKDLKYYENWWPTFDTCEIHSKTMELLTMNYSDMFMGETSYKYKYESLTSLLKQICYICLIDEFQHEIYDKKLSMKERKDVFRKLEHKYMPWIKYGDNDYLERGNTYQKQIHIFSHPFYYIDYALAYLVSLQFYKMSLENENDTWKKYIDFCSLGGTYSFIDTLIKSKLDSPFRKDYLKDIINMIDIGV